MIKYYFHGNEVKVIGRLGRHILIKLGGHGRLMVGADELEARVVIPV